MRDAYIILAHRAPWQVNELTEYLSEAGHDVFIHVDKGCEIASQLQINDHVRVLSDSVKIEWADWSMIEATLLLLQTLPENGCHYRYVHLLSGQCLPAMPLKKLDAELDNAYADGKQFMECKRLPRKDNWGRDGGIHRVGTWFPRWIVSKYSPWHKWFWWYTNKWIRLKLRRPLYYVFRPFYGGSQWWSLTGACAASLTEYALHHPFLRYFFHHSFCSDELFFQTCMSRSSYLACITNDNRRYLQWAVDNSASPVDLQPEHWPEIWNSGAFFARKFNMQPGETRAYLQKLEEKL